MAPENRPKSGPDSGGETGAAVLRIGTRGSPLALAQAAETRRRLIDLFPDLARPGAIAVAVIRTTGDNVTDRPLADIGGKGLFTKELDEALQAGAIDLAVHSMKDMPTRLPDGLEIVAVLEREDVRDAWFARDGLSLEALPAGAVIGTASLRRQSQILARRPDLSCTNFRGNVGTRLDKLNAGVVDATILAYAGLRRLGLAGRENALLDTDVMLPAVAQGAIGIAARRADARARRYLHALDHTPTRLAVTAERAMLAVLDGSCRTPIAGLAEHDRSGGLILRALVARPDGGAVLRTQRRGAAEDARRIGEDVGRELRARTVSDFGEDFFSSLASGAG